MLLEDSLKFSFRWRILTADIDRRAISSPGFTGAVKKHPVTTRISAGLQRRFLF